MSERPITIIFQMGKVASQSWFEAVKAAAPGAPVFHLHFVSDEVLAFIRGLARETGPTQTIKRPPMLLKLATLPAELADRFAGGRWVGGPVRIVTGVRDPVSRAMSALQHAADVTGHKTVPLAFREGGKVDTLLSLFQAGWSDALGETRSDDTFARWLSYVFGLHRTWFDSELRSAFSIDVRSAARRGRTWRIGDGPVEVLIYRQEDVADADVIAEAGRFLALDLGRLPAINQTARRRSGGLYQELQRRSVLARETLERIYSDPILALFYSTGDIAEFKARHSGVSRV